MWSVNKGGVQHARFRSASAWRGSTAALYLFAAIFQSIPLLVCCLSTWPHVCVLGVPPLLSVKYIPTIRLPSLSLKLIVQLLRLLCY